MRIPAQCPRCREVDERRQSMYEVSSGKRSSGIDPVNMHEIDAADIHSGKLTLRCKRGHTTEVKLPVPEFELLFDLGCFQLLDGYPGGAVTSFASSFERFQEFTCRFLLARRNLSFEEVDAWFKVVGGKSEREMGSFVALWIAEFRRQPPTLPEKLIKLRNNYVHKGRIPSESEAKEYGEAVLRAEVGGIVTLRNCFNDEFEYDDFVEDYIIRPGENEPVLVSFAGNTVIRGMWCPNEPRPDEDDDRESWGLPPRDQNQKNKNTTDPTRLTMDRALQVCDFLRGLGLRRK
jgi:hypothetical protein